jgi:NADH-quinone oxidoreductase subunit M
MITGLLLLLPLLIALILFFMKDPKKIKSVALVGALSEFILMLAGVYVYATQCKCNLIFSIDWLQGLGVSLSFGMNGISLPLVVLTTFLVPLIVVSSFQVDYKIPSAFYGLIFLMEMAFIGVFTTFDGLVFYIFWELALIPAWFITAIWGGKDRIRITFKFFIYTFTGSLFMLVALIVVYFRTPFPHSFAIPALYQATLSGQEQLWIFLALFLAFAIKIPVFPFHTWQPDTYAEAPAGGTMLLSGIMLKMGLYGLIRFVVPLCPDVIREWGMIVMILAIIGIIYASVIAIRQNDLKRLVAWSSIAHVGLITAGILTLTSRGLQGAVIQMVSHGINIVGLFILISIIEQRVKTRSISSLGGIATVAPWFAAFFMVIMLGSVALPLTNGFIGEFLLLLGIFEYNHWLAGFAGLTIIFGAVYMFWMYQRTMFGKTNELTATFQDLRWQEIAVLVPVAFMILWMGIFPFLFLKVTAPAVLELLNYVR